MEQAIGKSDPARFEESPAMQEAKQRRDQAHREKMREEELKSAEMHAALREIAARHAEVIREADSREWDAQRDYLAARVEASRASAPWREGTVLRRWSQRWNGYKNVGDPTPTEEWGVFEVWTEDSSRPDNLPRWRRPLPGDRVVRHMLKSGKPGKHFSPLTRYWVPEGGTFEEK